MVSAQTVLGFLRFAGCSLRINLVLKKMYFEEWKPHQSSVTVRNLQHESNDLQFPAPQRLSMIAKLTLLPDLTDNTGYSSHADAS